MNLVSYLASWLIHCPTVVVHQASGCWTQCFSSTSLGTGTAEGAAPGAGCAGAGSGRVLVLRRACFAHCLTYLGSALCRATCFIAAPLNTGEQVK